MTRTLSQRKHSEVSSYACDVSLMRIYDVSANVTDDVLASVTDACVFLALLARVMASVMIPAPNESCQ